MLQLTRPHHHVTADHYDLFPKSLGEVVHQHGVAELHLTLTQGLWKSSRWGYPLRDAPPGLELVAWFKEGLTERSVVRGHGSVIRVVIGLRSRRVRSLVICVSSR